MEKSNDLTVYFMATIMRFALVDFKGCFYSIHLRCVKRNASCIYTDDQLKHDM